MPSPAITRPTAARALRAAGAFAPVEALRAASVPAIRATGAERGLLALPLLLLRP